MPDKSEWLSGLPNYSHLKVTDTLYGKTKSFSQEVAFTRFGEFAAEVGEGGELLAVFPEQGLMYIFEQEGDLLMTLVDVGLYLKNLTYEQIMAMPNRGNSVLGLIECLKEEKLTMLMTLTFGGMDNFNLVVLDDKGREQVAKDMEGVDFGKGLNGELGIRENSVAFEVTKTGDDLVIAFGERRGSKVNLVSVESSLFVNFEDNLFGDDNKRLQNLAGKIILNGSK